MVSKFHKSLDAAFNNFAKKAEAKPKPKKGLTSWAVTKAQKQMLFDIDNMVIIPIMYTDYLELVLDFRCLKDNHKINRPILLALWRKHLIRYNYKRLYFELTDLGLKFISLNAGKETPGIINVKPPTVPPYKSKRSLRYEKYINKNKG